MNPFVDTQWLAENINGENIVVLDGAWRMPGQPPAREDFIHRHLPSAQFFDIDDVADRSSGLPHMLPTAELFERKLADLGISRDSNVIVYEESGLFSSPRVWWTFRVFGFDRVRILVGGLKKWMREGRLVENGEPRRRTVTGDTFVAAPRRELVANAAKIRTLLRDPAAIVLDVRPANRFDGAAEEPRPGLRCGHMPGAVNLPASSLLDEHGDLRDEAGLRQILGQYLAASAIATSCGSGVTAALAMLAFVRIGRPDIMVYDGSWAEWGRMTNSLDEFPVAVSTNDG